MVLPFDNITSTTLQLIRKRLADNVFKANPTAAWFLMRGRVQLESGGKFIQEPLMYATNGTTQSYRGYDRLNVAPTEELTSAQYSWRQMAASVSISGLEELENDGAQAVFNLLRAKVQVAELSLRQWFDEKLHASTATKDLTRDFLGLDEIIEDGSTFGTLGGIDRNAETWWRNKQKGTSASPFAVSSGSASALNNAMTNLYYEVTKGQTQPDLILTSQEIFERYENDNRDKQRLTDNRLIDVGFMNIKFKNATMMWNENIQGTATTAQYMYMINSEFMRIVLHRKRNFIHSPFQSPYDQDAKVMQILAAGNMTCNNSRYQGVGVFNLS